MPQLLRDGRVLTGPGAHACDYWDGLPVDETCREWPCGCALQIQALNAARPPVRSEPQSDNHRLAFVAALAVAFLVVVSALGWWFSPMRF
jgi:hypothetical protein